MASNTTSPIDVYFGATYSPKNTNKGTSVVSTSSSAPPDNSSRVAHAVLDSGGGQQGGGVDRQVPELPLHRLVPDNECTACKTYNIPLYLPFTNYRVQTFIDSGATDHCWVERSQFTEYRGVDEKGSSAVTGTEGQFRILGIGTVEFTTQVNGEKRLI